MHNRESKSLLAGWSSALTVAVLIQTALIAGSASAQMDDPDTDLVTIGGFHADRTLSELVREDCVVSILDSNVHNAFGANLVAEREAFFRSDGELERVEWKFWREDDEGLPLQGRPHLVVVEDLVNAIEGHLGIDLREVPDTNVRSGIWGLDLPRRYIFRSGEDPGLEGSRIGFIEVKLFGRFVRLKVNFNEGLRETLRACAAGSGTPE